MKTNTTQHFLAAAALVVAGSAFAQEAPVRIKTEGLPAHVAERLQAKAQEGPTALIQYVNRTRMQGHQVRVDEIVVTDAPVVVVRKDGAKVAKAEEAKK